MSELLQNIFIRNECGAPIRVTFEKTPFGQGIAVTLPEWEEAMSVIRWYADQNNYKVLVQEYYHVARDPVSQRLGAEIDVDEGQKARDFIAKVEGK